MARLAGAVLVAVHVYLVLWAMVGTIELFVEPVPWPRVTNPLFPTPILIMHWLLVAAAGSTFLIAYLGRWRYTPEAMVVAYLGLAIWCAIETFGYLRHETKFVDMGLEYVTYGAILALLFRARYMRRRFGRT